MKINLLEERNGTVHIHELVDTDLIHIDSVNKDKVVDRLKDYLEECGCTEKPDITHFVDSMKVLDIVSTSLDALGCSYINEVVSEVHSWLAIRGVV